MKKKANYWHNLQSTDLISILTHKHSASIWPKAAACHAAADDNSCVHHDAINRLLQNAVLDHFLIHWNICLMPTRFKLELQQNIYSSRNRCSLFDSALVAGDFLFSLNHFTLFLNSFIAADRWVDRDYLVIAQQSMLLLSIVILFFWKGSGQSWELDRGWVVPVACWVAEEVAVGGNWAGA